VQDAINEVQEAHQLELANIAERAREIEERYAALYEDLGNEVAERYRKLQERFARHMEPLREELEEVEAEVRQALEDIDVHLPEQPEGEAPPDGGRTWLFDSERDFVEQTDHFHRIQGKKKREAA
jgi:hypothetical protein